MRLRSIAFSLFLSGLASLTAEQIYIGAFQRGDCNQFEVLGAYQMGSDIMVNLLRYNRVFDCDFSGPSRPIVLTVEVDGPAIVAHLLKYYEVFSISANGTPVPLNLMGEKKEAYNPSLASEYASSDLIGLIDVRFYPWVYSELLGWLYVMPMSHSELRQFEFHIWQNRPTLGEVENTVELINTYWLYTLEGDWLYVDIIHYPYIWNANTSEWIISQAFGYIDDPITVE